MASKRARKSGGLVLPMPLRDRIATTVIAFAGNRIATRDYRERLVRVFRTGDPEERVPVEQVIFRG